MCKRCVITLCGLLVLVSCMSTVQARLVGWWRFEEGEGTTIRSEVDSPAMDATIIDTVAWTDLDIPTGISSNYALQFTGIGHIEANSFMGIGGNAPRSVTAWIRSEELANTNTVVNWGENASGRRFTVRFNGGWGGGQLGAFRVEVQAGFITGTAVVTDNEWHHVGCTFDGGSTADIKLYVDGELDAPSNIGDRVLDTDTTVNSFNIGAWPNGQRRITGTIDEVRIYDHALTGKEVQVAMRGEANPYAIAPDPADGAVIEATFALLEWSPGDTAVSHHVYVGTDADAVANATTEDTDIFQNTVTDTFFLVGIPTALVPGQMYYWRIDEFDGDTVHTGDVWSFRVSPKTAWNPIPANGAKFISADTRLEWTAGWGAISHTVFFGEDADTVANATEGTVTALTSFTPPALEAGKTYYWRVDEFSGIETLKGDVWQFTVTTDSGGLKGMYFGNQDLTGNPIVVREDPGIDFIWGDAEPAPGVPADGFGVRWVGELEIAVTEAYTFYVHVDNGGRLYIDDQLVLDGWAGQAEFEYKSSPVMLEGGQVYPIVMEHFDSGGSALARLSWESASTAKQVIPRAAFTPPIRAARPQPKNKAEDVAHDVVLKWIAGDLAKTHRVYLGTDATAVAAATPADTDIYQGEVDTPSFTPDALSWNTTYFWRIDEVNDLNPDSPWPGSTWSFTVADFLVVDNMESYTGEEGDEIWMAWWDGYLDPPEGNGSGSQVGLLDPPYVERNSVNGGLQAMPLFYDNSGANNRAYYSEAERTFDKAQDWTLNDVNTLSLAVQGVQESPTGSVYDADTGTYTVTGAGNNIATGTGDHCHYVYTTMQGDGSIVARVDAIQPDNVGAWAKVGVMIRESLDPLAPFVVMSMQPAPRVQMQSRAIAGDTTAQSINGVQGEVQLPIWIRLTRNGSVFNGAYSTDGTTWVENINPDLINTEAWVTMGSSVLVGLSVTPSSADLAAVCEATYTQVSLNDTPVVLDQSADIGLAYNTPANLYVEVEDAAGKTAVLPHPDNPMAVNGTEYTDWTMDLAGITGQGVNVSQVQVLRLRVGDKDATVAGGQGRLNIDDIRVLKP